MKLASTSCRCPRRLRRQNRSNSLLHHMEDGSMGGAINNNPMGKDQGRPKVKARASELPAWSPRSSRAETMCPWTHMAGGCASSSTWGVAQRSPMVVNVTAASIYACGEGVMRHILNQNTLPKTRAPAKPPLDYMSGFRGLPPVVPRWLIAWSLRYLQEAAGLRHAYASWV